MAVREIKTTLAVDGEKAFNKAVTEAGRNMRVMASEMKAAAADFNLTGDEMDYLGRKSQSLKGQIDQQEAIIRALEGAVADAAKEYGEASAKADGYRIKLNNAQASMAKLKKELEDANREMTDMGRDAGRVGRQLEEGIGDAAEDAGRKLDSMVNKLHEDMADIRSSVDISAFADIGDIVSNSLGGVYDGIKGVIDGTVEFRRSMSFLEQNALTAGLDPGVIKAYTFEVAALTGDLDAAVEGMSNLMAAGFEMDEMSTAMDRLTAAAIRFPDTLKFESLADSLQESVKTGKAVGQYAEYLERLGIDIETVDKSLSEASKKGQEAVETAALSWLSDEKAEKALETYKEMNQGLIDGQLAQQKWNDEVARTAEILQPYATALTNYSTGLLDLFNEAISGEKTINGKAAKIWWLPDLNKEKTAVSVEETGFFSGMQKSFEEAAKKTALWLDGLFKDEDVETAKSNSKTIGENIGSNIGEGIENKVPQVASEAAAMFQAIEAELNKTIQGPTIQTPKNPYGGATSYGGQGSVTVPLTLDGKNVGNTTFPYISSSMGEAVARAETYG